MTPDSQSQPHAPGPEPPLRRGGGRRVTADAGARLRERLATTTASLTPAGRRRRELVPYLRRLGQLAALLGVLVLSGTVGFTLTEGVSVWHAFVRTLDTVSTLGSIPTPDDAPGQVVQVVLIVLGVGTLFYGLATAAEFFVAGHLTGLLDERRQQRVIDALSDHFLICGYGRVGRQVARDLRTAGMSYVVIDSNPDNRDHAGDGVRFIEGSPSEDEVLRSAGIMRAAGIVACVDSDAENIFITLTARELRSDITIVARAAADHSEKKLRRAGADRVISPYKASGHEMARQVLHPQISGTIDVATEYRFEQIEVSDGCPGAHRRIEEVRGTAVIVGLQLADGTFVPQPEAHSLLHPGDRLLALGPAETMDRLEGLFDAAPR